MSLQKKTESTSAEMRFRQAFVRLKDGKPIILPIGTPVSQNNVAREAGLDPSALKKARFPALVREIQAYVELNNPKEKESRSSKMRVFKRADKARLADALRQRDMVQSVLSTANLRIIELTEEVNSLQRRLDDLMPPPSKIGKL